MTIHQFQWYSFYYYIQRAVGIRISFLLPLQRHALSHTLAVARIDLGLEDASRSAVPGLPPLIGHLFAIESLLEVCGELKLDSRFVGSLLQVHSHAGSQGFAYTVHEKIA